MRLPIYCSLIASTSLTAAACGGASAPKTAQELGDRVVAALVAKDWTAIEAMHLNFDAIKGACAEMDADKLERTEKEFGREKTKAADKFKKCLETDWTGAKVTGVTGGEAGKPVKGCGENVLRSKDVEIAVEVGDKKYTVKVDDPTLFDGGYGLVGGLRCKGAEVSCDAVYDNMVKLVAAAPDAKERDKVMFSGEADKKGEFSKMCDEMRGNAMFAPMLECVAAATTYAEMNACEDKVKGEMKDEPVAPPTGEAPAPADGAAPVAPAAVEPVAGDVCAKYIANFTLCVESVPAEVKESFTKAIEEVKKQIDGKPLEQTNAMCTSALAASKQSLGSLCPSVNWD